MPMAVALMTITGSCIANCGSFQFRHKAVFKSVRGSRNKGEKRLQLHSWLHKFSCGCSVQTFCHVSVASISPGMFHINKRDLSFPHNR